MLQGCSEIAVVTWLNIDTFSRGNELKISCISRWWKLGKPMATLVGGQNYTKAKQKSASSPVLHTPVSPWQQGCVVVGLLSHLDTHTRPESFIDCESIKQFVHIMYFLHLFASLSMGVLQHAQTTCYLHYFASLTKEGWFQGHRFRALGPCLKCSAPCLSEERLQILGQEKNSWLFQ